MTGLLFYHIMKIYELIGPKLPKTRHTSSCPKTVKRRDCTEGVNWSTKLCHIGMIILANDNKKMTQFVTRPVQGIMNTTVHNFKQL